MLEAELVFWQSIANSTDPADFEAYLAQFPNGVFRALARNRLSALSVADGTAATSVSRTAGAAAGVDARGRPGSVFRPDQPCSRAAGRRRPLDGDFRTTWVLRL